METAFMPYASAEVWDTQIYIQNSLQHSAERDSHMEKTKQIDVLNAEKKPVLPRCNMATDNRNGNDTSNKPLPCSTENQDLI